MLVLARAACLRLAIVEERLIYSAVTNQLRKNQKNAPLIAVRKEAQALGSRHARKLVTNFTNNFVHLSR